MDRWCIVVLSFAFALSACEATQNLDAQVEQRTKYITAPNPIPDEFIVVVADSELTGLSSLTAREQLQNEFSGEVMYTYEHALDGYAAKMPQSLALELAASPLVEYVVENGVVSINLDQPNATWGLDRIDQRDLPLDSIYSYLSDGNGVHAYIIDTGVRQSHVEFTGRVGDGIDTVDNDSDPDDCNGHGTHVAGTVAGTTYGVAKQAIVHGVRVLSCGGSGSNAGVIAGIDWVTANHISPAVANMSLGGGFSQAINDAVANAIDAGVFFAVAAGNETTNACTKSPASTPTATTVGSTTSSDLRSSFSNFGTCVDIFAPGSSITSAWYTSDTATNTISGTSMASPHVAGAAAAYLGIHGNDSPAQVDTALKNLASTDKLSDIRTGSPNLLLYTGFMDGGDNTPPVVDITSPADGSTVNGTIPIAADASDESGIAQVAFYLDGSLLGSDAAAPYSFTWNSATVQDGEHTIQARATDGSGLSSSDQIVVTVENGGGGDDEMAAYDPSLGTAACLSASSTCNSGTLFNSRGSLSPPEPNAPNTLDGCADGNTGSYHSDESNDAVRAFTLSGNDFAPGETVRVEATVWAYATGSADNLDVFYATDASQPAWTLVGTVGATGGQLQTLALSFELQSGDAQQAIRVQWRYGGSPTPCTTGSYDDRDDLVITVAGDGGDVTPPTVTFSQPADGAEVSGEVTLSALAADDTAVREVAFFVDGALVGTDSTSPYLITWPSTGVDDGAHTVQARAEDTAGNTGDDWITVLVDNSGGGGDGEQAVYDPVLGTAACASATHSCESGSLFNSRGNVSPSEPNAPNTLDNCADGSSGTYHNDESNDAVKVSTLSGNDFAEGETVQVEATVWAYSTGSSDSLDVFYARDATQPTWELISTIPAGGSALQTLSTTFELGSGGDRQAVRVQWRYNSSATPCSDGSYNDRDDLVIRVTDDAEDGLAVYDPAFGTAVCDAPSDRCDSGVLFDGRGTVGDDEPNAPNTVDGCNDGNTGTYHLDESLDRLEVVSVSGNDFAPAETVKVDATVWAYSTGGFDRLDIFYATDAAQPVWTLIDTLSPSSGGENTLTTSFELQGGADLQAIRGQWRYQDTPVPCAAGGYNDRDDLLIRLAE